MATTKASRKAKRDPSSKDHDSDAASTTMKTRKTHDSKEAITRGALKKSNMKARETREYIMKKQNQPIARNGRQPGRQLIRWNACTDQILLLIMEYELKRHGVNIPFDAIAKRLASEKDTTGPCVQQHLAKLRKEMLARGSWVPPLSGKPNSKQSDVRGIVMVKKRNGESEIKELSWTEDAFKYVDLPNLVKGSTFKSSKYNDNGEGIAGTARHLFMTERSSVTPSENEMDPADLPSEEEFDPHSRKERHVKKFARASAKLDKNSKRNCYTAEYDDEEREDDSETVIKREGSHQPVMMALYESDAEEERKTGIVVLRLSSYLLSEYPEGVSEYHSLTDVIQVGDTDAEGEEVLDDAVALHPDFRHPAKTAENYHDTYGGNEDYSIMDANTAENYEEAFGDQNYSIMDANTAENYEEAFGDQSYSIMDANTAENYEAAFEVSDEDNSRCGFVAESKDSDLGEEQVPFGNFMGMKSPTSSGIHNTSTQTAHGYSEAQSNTIGHDALDQNDFNTAVRDRDLLIGGPMNRAPHEDSYEGMTVAAAMAMRGARQDGGNDNNLGQVAGLQAEAESNDERLIDIDDDSMDGFRADDSQGSFPDFMSAFNQWFDFDPNFGQGDYE